MIHTRKKILPDFKVVKNEHLGDFLKTTKYRSFKKFQKQEDYQS